MPPGAVRAVIVDDGGAPIEAVVEGGAWHSEVVSHEGLVRFEAADGALVAQPLPPGPRRAINDAPEPCPVCGAVAWVDVAGAICCERCGWALFGPPPPEAEAPKLIQVAVDAPVRAAKPDREERRRRREAARAAVTFPVYARVGKAVRIGGSSGDSHGELTSTRTRPSRDA